MQHCRFDQTANSLNPVDESLNSVIQSSSSQTPPYPAPPTNLPLSYHSDLNTASPGIPPEYGSNSIACFQPLSQPFQGFPGQPVTTDNHKLTTSVPAANPGISSSVDLHSRHVQQSHPSQLINNQQRQPTRSFSINQHIGLDEPPVVNVSQLNNSIKVQYQFGLNDKFAVQSTNSTVSNGSDFIGWQNHNDSHQCDSVNEDLKKQHNQPETSSDINGCRSNEEFEKERFSVFNIHKKSDENIDKSSNIYASHLNSVNKNCDILKDTRKNLQTLIKKQQEKIQTCNENIETHEKKSKNIDKTVSTGNNIDQGTVPDLLAQRRDIELPKGRKSEIANTNFFDKGEKLLKTHTSDIDKVTLTESNSNISIAKKSLKKTKASVIPKSKGGANSVKKSCKKSDASAKKSTSRSKKTNNEITLVKFSYQCGECADTYHSIGDLFKHINEKHSENPVANVGTNEIDSKTDKDLDKSIKNSNDKVAETLKNSEETELNKFKTNVNTIEEVEENIVNEDNNQIEEVEEETVAGETEEHELDMEVESENIVTEPECLLCPICAYASNSPEEEERHKKTHERETERHSECHTVEREYMKQCQEMFDVQRKNIEERSLDGRKQKENHQSSLNVSKVMDGSGLQKQPNISGPKAKKVADKSEPTTDSTENYLEKKKTGLRNREKTQAKNSLMNPSKGKQKRVRDTHNFGKEDRMLMEMFGIIPSKVCLSRVEDSDKLEAKSRNNTVEEPKNDIENIKIENERFKEETLTGNKKVKKNHWSKVLGMSNCENEENVVDDQTFDSDDSDIEIVEPPVTLIVLDDEVSTELEVKDSLSKTVPETPEKGVASPKRSKKVGHKKPQKGSPTKSDKGSPVKLDKKGKESTGAMDASVEIERGEKEVEFSEISRSGNSDAELLEKYGIKNLRINLTHTPSKVKQTKPGPKSKCQTNKGQLGESKSYSNAPIKDIEEMSPTEIEKLLYECGMGITVPVQSKVSSNEIESPDRADQTPSPVPSTSKGHGHLKRKRTARKSTKDSALFKKYKLKDSKVIIENLSRIDVSMIRNPNSPFGKSDWLQHKFDSDTDSDFDFDIPTPPLVEEFDESVVSPRNNRETPVDLSSHRHVSPSKPGGKSPLNQKELQEMEKFGISESVVVIDSPKKTETTKASKSSKKKTISDEELRKKFGIPNTMVVIKTPEKTQETCMKGSSVNKVSSDSKGNHISFADFQSALDSARKNILSKMKSDSKLDSTVAKRVSAINKECTKQHKKEGGRKSGMKVEHNKNCIDSKIKKSNNEPSLPNRKLRIRSKANETSVKVLLPNKLKSLTVDINKLKLNEACKTFKARAVSRAIESGRKKDKIAKELDDNIKKSVQKIKQKTPPKSVKRVRENVPGDLSENSSKRKCMELKAKQDCTKEIKFERKVQVVKTARYRRSVVGKKSMEETFRKPDLRQLAKGLPIVKVAVSCLTNEEIIRLSQNIEDSAVSVKNKVEFTSEEVASQIINELLDKILLKEVSGVKSKLTDCCGDTSFTSSGESYVTDSTVEDFISGEENSDLLKEDIDNTTNLELNSGRIDFVEQNNIKTSSFDTKDRSHEVHESESDLSLISDTLENKENENNSLTECEKESDKDTGVKSMLDKKTSQIDVIHIGKIRFYDEDIYVSENFNDEVDGDIVVRTKESHENDGNGTSDRNQGEDSNKNSINPEECDLTAHQANSGTGHSKDRNDDVNDEKENRMGEVHSAEKDSAVMKVQKLSSIIDSKSGTLIGDVYSIGESIENSSDGGRQEKGDTKEVNYPISPMGNVSRISRSPPVDIIEAVTES
ncbi:uncharacterized protein LOC132719508 isoform X2 [Ruditapes philippinarum]|nr:uncharacterized protein LOC132719508 isoform X2 [Ruditapes philippinarum]